jgi:hypothetical protein
MLQVMHAFCKSLDLGALQPFGVDACDTTIVTKRLLLAALKIHRNAQSLHEVCSAMAGTVREQCLVVCGGL